MENRREIVKEEQYENMTNCQRLLNTAAVAAAAGETTVQI